NEPQRLMWLEISPIIAHGQEFCLSEIGHAQRLMQGQHPTRRANGRCGTRHSPEWTLVLGCFTSQSVVRRTSLRNSQATPSMVGVRHQSRSTHFARGLSAPESERRVGKMQY